MPDYAFKSGQTKSYANGKGNFRPFQNTAVKGKPIRFGATVFDNCSCSPDKDKKLENAGDTDMENRAQADRISNAGTSEGVKKAWETRKAGGGACVWSL